VDGWIEWDSGPGCHVFSRFFVVSHSFYVACFVCWLVFAFGAHSACYGQQVASWGYEMMVRTRRRMVEEEDGGRGEPGASHQVAGEELWWEHGSHHYKATRLSGCVTWLGLSRLCITPSRRLDNLHWTASDTTIQRLTSTIIILSLSFFFLLFLSHSQSTISPRRLPPCAPRNESSVFVVSYGTYCVPSPDL